MLGALGYLTADSISARPSATGGTVSRMFWIAEGAGMGPNRETHFAFAAADDDAVRAFHDAAVELGAESLHAPRLWPEYHEGYFAAFVRDLDGNNVEAVCHA